MKRIAFILLLILSFTACEKNPETGDLLVVVEYDDTPEENVEVWLYDSYAAFNNYEFTDKLFTDQYGEVFWADLLPGTYYLEAKITKSSLFKLSAIDSIEVVVNIQKNKLLILTPEQ